VKGVNKVVNNLQVINRERSLVVKEKQLTDYLALKAAGHVCARRYNSRQTRPVLDSNLFRVSVS
jgi:hypothetical protein